MDDLLWRSAVFVGAFALAFSSFGAGTATGHGPVQGANDLYADGVILTYRFGGSYPNWVETAMNSGLQSRWEQNNNSDGPRFDHAQSTGTGRLFYDTATGVFECDRQAWIGCAANGGLSNWKIWLRKDQFTFCEVSSVTGCFLAKRVILHEAEHITLGVGSHDEQSANVTNMNSESPSKPNAGWDSNEPRSCDEAALQLRYGLGDLAGPYSGCLDHAPGHGNDGLITRLSLSTTDGTTCAGDSISRSGQLQTKTDTDYDRLSSVNIAQRTIWIDRDAGANGSWTNDWASDSTNSTGGNNWSHSFSENPAVTTSYAYRVHFKGQTGLDPDYSATFVLTFLRPCPPP
jgi:hypothetical protein